MNGVEDMSTNKYAHRLGVDATAVTLHKARDPAVIEHKFRDMAMLVR